MRILNIVPQAFYTARGTPLSAYHRVRELMARGHQVCILTYAVGGGAPANFAGRVIRARGPHFKRAIRAGPVRALPVAPGAQVCGARRAAGPR